MKKEDDLIGDVFKLFNNEVTGNQEVERIIIEDGFLVIKHRVGFDYDIHLDKLKEYKDIVGWIAHLNEKEWFTNEVLYCFLNVINGHFDSIIDKSR